MSTSFQQLAAESLLVPGSELKFGKLKLKHCAEYAQYIGFKEYHKAKLNDPPKEILDELFRKGLNTNYDPNSPEVLGSVLDPICFSKLLEISLKVGNPKATEKQIQEILDAADETFTADLINKFLDMQGLVSSETEKN